jgi:hypothetical protein
VEKLGTLYGAYRVEKAKRCQINKRKMKVDWEEEDFQSLGLDKYLLDLIVISSDKKIARKLFAFAEDWELEVLNDNKSPHSETILVHAQVWWFEVLGL